RSESETVRNQQRTAFRKHVHERTGRPVEPEYSRCCAVILDCHVQVAVRAEYQSRNVVDDEARLGLCEGPEKCTGRSVIAQYGPGVVVGSKVELVVGPRHHVAAEGTGGEVAQVGSRSCAVTVNLAGVPAGHEQIAARSESNTDGTAQAALAA